MKRDRFDSHGVARELERQLVSATPDIAWVVEQTAPGGARVGLPGRLSVTLEDCREGVRAQITEPGLPGEDPPAAVLRAGYDVTSFARELSWRCRIEPGTVALHALRKEAVYEVLLGFTDHQGGAFPAGTRLTFVGRAFLPYEGGHTLSFREATVYLQEDAEACRHFARFFAYARDAAADPP